MGNDTGTRSSSAGSVKQMKKRAAQHRWGCLIWGETILRQGWLLRICYTFAAIGLARAEGCQIVIPRRSCEESALRVALGIFKCDCCEETPLTPSSRRDLLVSYCTHRSTFCRASPQPGHPLHLPSAWNQVPLCTILFSQQVRFESRKLDFAICSGDLSRPVAQSKQYCSSTFKHPSAAAASPHPPPPPPTPAAKVHLRQ